MNKKIVSQDVQMPNQVRIKHSDDCADIIRRLLTKDPDYRLGSTGGAAEVLYHPWFTDENADHYIDIERIKDRTEQPMLDNAFFKESNLSYFNASREANK